METIGLIDGDIFAFEIAASAEEAINWDGDFWTLHAFQKPAEARLKDRLETIKDTIKADRLIVCLTDKDNWRSGVLATYKQNRVGQRKPMLLGAMKQYMEDNYETYLRPSLEADDILGILATGSMLKGKKIIVTKDKDLKTIPAPIYLTHKTELGIVETTEEEADRFHLMQALAGDTTDGYAGCPTIGMETAAKIIDGLIGWEQYEHTFKSGNRKGTTEKRWRSIEVATPWEAVVSTYNKQGLSEEEALRQARVARILRAEDYDFKNKQVKLWKP